MENPLAKTPTTVEWVHTLELGYMEPNMRPMVCFGCGKAPSSSSPPSPSTSTTTSTPKKEANVDSNAITTTDTTTTTTTITTAATTTTTPPPPPKKQKQLSQCAKCHVAAYCSRECQVNDWKNGGHKRACATYARVASHVDALRDYNTKTTNQKQHDSENDDGNDHDNHPPVGPPTLDVPLQTTLRNELFGRIRFYACPYAVFKEAQLGRGFLFLQSDRTLVELTLGVPKDCTGRIISRAVLLHYLTLGEFDAELCREDFELCHVRPKLQEAVDTYDPETQVVLLCRFRDGHMAAGKAVLVPDVKVCRKLGKDYYSEQFAGVLQLNLDDL